MPAVCNPQLPIVGPPRSEDKAINPVRNRAAPIGNGSGVPRESAFRLAHENFIFTGAAEILEKSDNSCDASSAGVHRPQGRNLAVSGLSAPSAHCQVMQHERGRDPLAASGRRHEGTVIPMADY